MWSFSHDCTNETERDKTITSKVKELLPHVSVNACENPMILKHMVDHNLISEREIVMYGTSKLLFLSVRKSNLLKYEKWVMRNSNSLQRNMDY